MISSCPWRLLKASSDDFIASKSISPALQPGKPNVKLKNKKHKFLFKVSMRIFNTPYLDKRISYHVVPLLPCEYAHPALLLASPCSLNAIHQRSYRCRSPNHWMARNLKENYYAHQLHSKQRHY